MHVHGAFQRPRSSANAFLFGYLRAVEVAKGHPLTRFNSFFAAIRTACRLWPASEDRTPNSTPIMKPLFQRVSNVLLFCFFASFAFDDVFDIAFLLLVFDHGAILHYDSDFARGVHALNPNLIVGFVGHLANDF